MVCITYMIVKRYPVPNTDDLYYSGTGYYYCIIVFFVANLNISEEKIFKYEFVKKKKRIKVIVLGLSRSGYWYRLRRLRNTEKFIL